ncbi:MAG: hypothetical protein ACREO2_04155, partial [Arenimonas sp.]
MSLSISTLVFALLIGIGVLAVGLEAYKQNRPLFQALRAGNRDIKSMLGHAFIVWSPVAVVIAVLLGAAYLISWGTTELVYRYTTLDEFCELQGLEPPVYIACTGMGNELPAGKIRQLEPREEIERQLFLRYRKVRTQLLNTPLHELRLQAKNRPLFLKTLLPAAVLGLPQGSDGDSVLSGLLTEKRRLLQSPIPIPKDIAEVLSYRQSVETRNRFLRDLDARIEARKKVLYIEEYGGLTQEQRLLRQQKNRVLLLMQRVNVGLDPAVQAALSSPTDDSADLVRQGLVRSLAHSERDALEILSHEIDTPANAAVVYDLLHIAPECTVATENADVRLNSSDFLQKYSDVDPVALTTNNSGSFPCFGKHDAKDGLRLVSVGFRKSVLLSIDRLRDEAALDAFKKLASLERNAARSAMDAKTARQE